MNSSIWAGAVFGMAIGTAIGVYVEGLALPVALGAAAAGVSIYLAGAYILKRVMR